jgi:hypothetical protein
MRQLYLFKQAPKARYGEHENLLRPLKLRASVLQPEGENE